MNDVNEIEKNMNVEILSHLTDDLQLCSEVPKLTVNVSN